MAEAVDDADVAGAVFGLFGHGREGQRCAARPTGADLRRPHRRDEPGALVEVARVQQAVPAPGRRGHKVRVGQVLRPVGKGQAGRLQVGVQPVGARWAVQRRGALRRSRQQAHDLPDGDGPRTGRRKSADAQHALQGRVIEAQGFALPWPVVPQVVHRQGAGPLRVALHLVDHRLRDGPFVQRARPLGGDLSQHGGQFRIAQHVTDRMWRAVGPIEVGRGHRVGLERGLGRQQGVQARADGEALLGQGDGVLEQAGPGQPAVLPVGFGQHGHGARHANRAAGGHRLHEGQRFAIVAQPELRRGTGRSGFTAIEGLHTATVEVQQEGPAADAARLRLHQGQHHLHGDGGIHRAAPGLQDGQAGLRRQRVGGGHRLLAEGPTGLGLDRRCGFGLCRGRCHAGRPLRVRGAGTGHHHGSGQAQ